MATVLVVDNEDAVRRAWEKALRNGNHHVWSAGTAQRALELCDEHTFDVVVLDFVMPGVDGVRLLTKIRKKLPFVRSLIVSGQLDTDVAPSDLGAELKAEVEADMYLHKPLSNDQLRAVVDELVSRPANPSDWKSMAQTATRAHEITDKKAAGAAKKLKARKKR